VFPLCGGLVENYTTTTVQKLYNGIWLGSINKKSYNGIGQLVQSIKIIQWEWLLAGSLSCHCMIIIWAKNYNVIKFGMEPDALLDDTLWVTR
jgi:hypothetical protein